MKISKKYWSLFISFFTRGIAIVLACAGGDWDSTEGSMFTPELINKPKYKPFFWTSATPFYGEDNFLYVKESCLKTNVTEWKTFFENRLEEKTLNYWLYNASGKEIGQMLFIVKGKKGTINDSSKANTLTTIQPEKASAFLFYLGFAKRNEAFTCNDEYGGGDEKENTATPTLPKQIEGGLKLFAGAKSDFIKERYIFQLVRLYYFNGQYSEAASFFETNKTAFKTGNSMQWRAMGYAAGAYYKLKKFSQANYYYSLIFDKSEEQQRMAYRSFHPQNDADWQGSLALAKSDQEKIVLWQMFGLYYEEAKAIEEIYKIDPKSDYMELLLTRGVNRFEGYDAGPQIVRMDEKEQRNFSKPVNEKLVATVSRIAKENKTTNLPLWDLCAAQLNYCNRNFIDGDKLLKEAEPGRRAQMFSDQYSIVSVFGKLNRESKMTESVEKNMLPEIKELFEVAKTERDITTGKIFRTSFAVSWVRNTLAIIYARQGEIEKAEMVDPGTVNGHFKKTENVKKMLAYFENPQKTELENFFISKARIGYDDYLQLLGITYTKEDKLDSALLVFKKTKSGTPNFPGNPFTIHIKDCHDCDHAAGTKTLYDSQAFVEKLVEMKKKASTDKKEAAQNYFLLANGFYNITWYGNARIFYANAVDGSSDSYAYDWGEKWGKGDVDLALKYYLLAAENSTDKEFKAKCYFMAAKCDMIPEMSTDNYGGVKTMGAEYYNTLIKDYSKTKYYQQIIEECSYFRHYIGK